MRRYDLYGSNFQVALRLALTSMAFDDEDELPPQVHSRPRYTSLIAFRSLLEKRMCWTCDHACQAPRRLASGVVQVPDSELPELPGELAGIWAYIKWEVAGCPNRSQQESDTAYQASIEASRMPPHALDPACTQASQSPMTRLHAFYSPEETAHELM